MTSFRFKILITAIALSFGSVGLASAAGAKSTQSTQGATAPECVLRLGTTKKVGNVIQGVGSQSRDCGTRGQTLLTIQWHRWNGWQPVATKKVVGSGKNVSVSFNCKGTGTHTFRTIHTGRTVGTRPLFGKSNEVRVTCP